MKKYQHLIENLMTLKGIEKEDFYRKLYLALAYHIMLPEDIKKTWKYCEAEITSTGETIRVYVETDRTYDYKDVHKEYISVTGVKIF